MIRHMWTGKARTLIAAGLIAAATMIGSAAALAADDIAPDVPALESEISEIRAVIVLDPEAYRRAPLAQRSPTARYAERLLVHRAGALR